MLFMNYHLRSMPTAQTHVEFLHDINNTLIRIRLFSYRTPILEIDRVEKDGEFVWVTNVVFNPAYSRTTARHVNRFIQELFGRNYYFDCKEAWENDIPLGELLTTNAIMNFYNDYQQYGKHFHY